MLGLVLVEQQGPQEQLALVLLLELQFQEQLTKQQELVPQLMQQLALE